MTANFDYDGAIAEGYSPDEINKFLKAQPTYSPTNQKGSFFQNIMNSASNFTGNFFNPTGRQKEESEEEEIDEQLLKKMPKFDVKGALEEGYTTSEINEFLEENQPERSFLGKAARIGGQLGLGVLENTLLPYELGIAAQSSKAAQQVPYRENLGEDIENLMIQKQSGNWSPEDEKFLQNLQEQIQDPSKSDEFIQASDLGVRGLIEKTTGLDLHPEGSLEKAAHWIGFIKNPGNIVKAGLKPAELFKAIAPTGTDILRGAGAGTALQMAEDGEYGPIGTIAMAVLGDVIGHSMSATGKSLKNLIKNPKETLARGAAKFTNKEKIGLQKDLIKDFRDSGIQADLGTITDSNVLKFMQARLIQSGLTGDALENLKKTMTQEVKDEYKTLSKALGEAKYSTTHEAGEIAKQGLRDIRDADLKIAKDLYARAESMIKENPAVNTIGLSNAIKSLEKKLSPGNLKSAEQKSVLDVLEKLKEDLIDGPFGQKESFVKDLINNKIALNDIINYEVQGGTKQLLKGMVKDIDRAIISHGKQNPSFAKNYVLANKKFSSHAKTFRNPTVEKLLKEPDPAKLLSEMDSIDGIRRLGNILSRTPEGKEIFNGLKRMKLDKVIGDNMVDNTSLQLKMGTFSNLLKKGKNKEAIKEILGADAFKRLEKLQKNVGKLAETAQKFFNASKTASTLEDIAFVVKALKDIATVFSGNPWPLLRTGGGLVGARYVNNLIADPQFLKMVEQSIIASEKNDISLLLKIGEAMIPKIKAAGQEQLSELKQTET